MLNFRNLADQSFRWEDRCPWRCMKQWFLITNRTSNQNDNVPAALFGEQCLGLLLSTLGSKEIGIK
jgi:hypothetical protein